MREGHKGTSGPVCGQRSGFQRSVEDMQGPQLTSSVAQELGVEHQDCSPSWGTQASFPHSSALSPSQPQAARSPLVGKGSRLCGPGDDPLCPFFSHLSTSLHSPIRGWDGTPETKGESRRGSLKC